MAILLRDVQMDNAFLKHFRPACSVAPLRSQ